MAPSGVVYRDLGAPQPHDEPLASPAMQRAASPASQHTRTPHDSRTSIYMQPVEHERANTMRAMPTESHALAMQNPEIKGLAQIDHGNEVEDLGWNEPKENIAAPLVGGLGNEELWLLIRRFNKQMYHVKEVTTPVPGNLDMNIAEEDEFSPDKFRSTIERLYMTVIIGFIGFGKHIARLRSWREQRRTAMFCTAYFLAWFFDLLMPMLILVLIFLISYPPCRDILFPPAPIALVDGSTGAPKKPKAGVLGSHDSVTGAPENHKGEAVEQEASNFVAGIANVALSSATGKHPMNDPGADGKGPQESIPDPSGMAGNLADARLSVSGKQTSTHQDKTKVPMETAMWNKMRPIMHVVGDIADTWERFANVLSPTPPFPSDPARLRLAGVFVPLLAVSLVTTAYLYTKGVSFGIGFGFFGDPVIQRGVVWLNREFPHWQRLLELRNSILKGVPTNAQLTITLLRTGEANKAPLPPPPLVDSAPPMKQAAITSDDLGGAGGDSAMGATPEELRAAAAHDPNVAHETTGSDIEASKTAKHGKKGARLLHFFRSTARVTVETALGADHLKATAGSEHAKERLGALTRPHDDLTSGPVEFRARHDGKKGHVYISAKATIPCVAFTTDRTVERVGTQDRDDLHPAWTVAVADISELKKVGGFGWKAKLLIGWATERQVADGLEIVDRRGGVWKITACPLRDELFNRLVAMGGQKWELW